MAMEVGAGVAPVVGPPRMTSVMRSLECSQQGLPIPDLSALTISRQKQLDEARKRSPGAAVKRSALAHSILGDWNRAPKAARDAYDGFIRCVGRLARIEADPNEVQDTAPAVWSALSSAGPPDVDRFRGASLARHKQALAAHGVPHVDESALPAAVDAVATLMHWQLQLVGTDAEVANGDARARAQAGEFAAGAAAPCLGDDLLFVPPRRPQGDPVSAVLGMGSGRQGGLADELRREARAAEAEEGERAARDLADAGASSDSDWSDEDADKHPWGSVKLGELMDWCERAVTVCQSPVMSSVDAMTQATCRALLTATTADAAAAELFDLLGEGGFELIGELLAKFEPLRALLQYRVREARESETQSAQAQMPVFARGFSVATGKMKEREKALRRDRRKGAGAVAGDLEWLQQVGLQQLVDEEVEREQAEADARVAERQAVGEGGPGGHTAGALPAGTVRKNFKGYQEVRVPATPTGEMQPGERLVPISELDEWAQTAFEGYKTLNRIQSRIFSTAYTTNQNMLVCAPTGAGKTNIAMLTVLHEVAQNMVNGVVQRGAFKVVYVAPMKALAGEVTAAFSKRLQGLGLVVRELTGDMQLTQKEMAETQMIVTTPEKWDVITRKGGDAAVTAAVKLLIIDEVHLLNDDRGPVIETLVARTLRLVEASQSMIRIVGLSATLPNYKDVATFLGVNHTGGLFFFDQSYRPVPLETHYLGVTETNVMAQKQLMNELAYDKCVETLRQGHQAMVFVHSRKDTGKTARALAEIAQARGHLDLFVPEERTEAYEILAREVKKSRNRELQEIFSSGFGMHHAGMLRSDRNLVEKLFARGMIKVLCCTATLAWGINLPAATVIIKGTQLYDAARGCFKDVGVLDVQQIFGRAGRPQYKIPGLGVILTTHDKLPKYLAMLTAQVPIESQFEKGLVDNLNAEIVLGTVTSVKEAATWLSYSYMYVRMMKNPLAYGIGWLELQTDPTLEQYRRKLVTKAARELEKCKMARFDERSGLLYVTELGRVASHFYIQHSTIVLFNEQLRKNMSIESILALMSGASEFENIAVREEELQELDSIQREWAECDVRGGVENRQGKVNALMQSYISRARIESFSLTADQNYVAQNAPRIARALFEICLRRGWPGMSETLLTLCKAFERRLWPSQHPLRQFDGALTFEVMNKVEDKRLSLERLWDMDAAEIGRLMRFQKAGQQVRECVESFPALELDCQIQPITRTVLRVVLKVTPTFRWKERYHGQSQRWLIWVEDSENEHLYHTELWQLSKRMASEGQHTVAFTIPIFEPLPSQYYVRAISDSWLHAEAFYEMKFDQLILPERYPPHTELLDLDPLPRSALGEPAFEAMYERRFTHFNPVQTQCFHVLYHTDENVLMGAPTGSGKTVMAELAMLRLFRAHPDMKVIYIAPLKALVRERLSDWGAREGGLCARLGKSMVELTGDYTPDLRALLAADIIIATPEKWDGISRNWQTRAYVKRVGLLVIDEIHLLGADRGPTIEVIVSRMRYIAAQTGKGVRMVGLSTALANAHDLSSWMGVPDEGLFNFKPSVRPVPLEAHIQGYPGKFYCPRMATMNKPAYAAIRTHSPEKPVLVFVSSRRQTRLTALDLIAYAAADNRPRTFLHTDDDEIAALVAQVRDASLQHTLQFGIGLHHAGLAEIDRKIVEKLFVEGSIQVLVATSTLAWGVNTPAHLVIIKGTEYYDAPSKRYVDYPITDVLQMMGRAGRPQYDRHGVAVIMVHEPKKSFYKKFLYEPFPVESSLPDQLSDHMNAEIVGGTVRSRQDAVDYLTWTFFFRRLLQNPSYYDLEDVQPESVNTLLSELIEDTLIDLESAGCLTVAPVEEGGAITPLTPGKIASLYYLQYTTMATFSEVMGPGMGIAEVLDALCAASEYDELPVRHNEDRHNMDLSDEVRFPIPARSADDPHAKASLLLQAHMGRIPLPISDYVTDSKAVLDNSIRILQAMIDYSADAGWLDTALSCMALVQSVVQARWLDDSSLTQLPLVTPREAAQLAQRGFGVLPQLVEAVAATEKDGKGGGAVEAALKDALGPKGARDVMGVCGRLPLVDVSVEVREHVGAGEIEDEDGVPGDVSAAVAKAAAAKAGGSVAAVPAGEWEVCVALERAWGKSPRNAPPRAYTPRFPKVKDEGWWLVLGDAEGRELLAMRRVSFGQKGTFKLTCPRAGGSGHALDHATLYLVSDCLLGLDQEVEVSFADALPAAKAQRAPRGRRQPARDGDEDARAAGDAPCRGKGKGPGDEYADEPPCGVQIRFGDATKADGGAGGGSAGDRDDDDDVDELWGV
ncbi:unnamed protein product [Pedinophyceae sp. YPF-701]|nr:unnamed protein product [Pedinophyceae sp. YPF-701]